MPNITVIPATRALHTKAPVGTAARRRVAGYARVSTDSDEQFTSYEAQVDYYTQFIKSRSDWELVDIYTDEGISGLSTKHRPGFNRMVEDALAGRIDLIVTKSVSRFARNTVDSLSTIRKLKEAGCECFFEKENIYTFDSKGELLLTIMSSLAQEESRSISENVTWGQRKRFADGKVSMPYKHFLGYEKGPDGKPKIVPEEAEQVRLIYDLFMRGMTIPAIAKRLTEEGIPTPAGKEKWAHSTVESILSNEKYKGHARLQKSFTVDYLTKKMKVNEGEVPQYYVEGSHPAIISPALFDRVQEELARRKALGKSYSGLSIFSSRIICDDCGSFFGPKVWNSTGKYRRVVWQCNGKFHGSQKCTTPHLCEDVIKEKFLEAYNCLLTNREQLLEDCRLMQTKLADTSDMDREIEELHREAQNIDRLMHQYINENFANADNQSEYLANYEALEERRGAIGCRLDELFKRKSELDTKAKAIGGFMFELSERDRAIDYFDDRLWLEVIDNVRVHSTGALTFKFRGDIEITL